MQTNRTVRKSIEPDARPVIRKKKKPRKKRYILLKTLLFVLVCMIIFMMSALYGYRYIMEGFQQAEAPISEDEGIVFKVAYGSSTTDIANALKEQGFIDNTWIFRVISKFMGFDSVYKAGRYVLTKDMNYYALMLALTGEPLKNPTQDIMIPEGKTILETAEILAAQGYIDKDHFLALCEQLPTQYLFLNELAVSPDRKYPLEGYLYPDTYKMDEGWTEQDLIDRMLRQFDRVFTYEYYQRAEELGMTIDEVVTLASLIEMEAKYPADYKKISSVFHNRLKKDPPMMLQCDATIQYARIYQGLGRTTAVLNKDLEIDSPYNTYKHLGLPPGPICSPRADAIEAALYPEETKYLYFFATPDGINIYNETFEGHLRDQNKYGVSGYN
ncbi:MAG TPA: endolytic transglycosylase MltG [Thermoclostridium sp.]|nr:endolytic transglycosylase MltG [Thermoclostridium sp.]